MKIISGIITFLGCMLVVISLRAQNYIYEPVSSNGIPSNASSITVSDGEVAELLSVFTSPNLSGPYSHFLNPTHGGLDIKASTSISLTYVTEDAGYQNSVGYYTYSTGSPPSSASGLNLHVVFPNIDNTQMSRGTTLDMGTFHSGTTIGFFLISDGWNNSTINQVNSSAQHLYSTYDLNDDGSTQVNSKQNAIAYYSTVNKYVIGWDDQLQVGSNSDKDYNDVILYINLTDASAVPQEDYPDVAQPDNDPYPVELIRFEGRKENGCSRLLWATASEINNDHFTLFHSDGNSEFTRIAEIPGNGNTNQVENYSYLHRNPAEGINYYKLVQTDFDGTSSTGKIITINFGRKTDLRLMPNPLEHGDILNVSTGINKPGLISIYSSEGKLVYQKEVKNGNAKLQPGLSKGIYLLRFTAAAGDVISTERLIIH